MMIPLQLIAQLLSLKSDPKHIRKLINSAKAVKCFRICSGLILKKIKDTDKNIDFLAKETLFLITFAQETFYHVNSESYDRNLLWSI